MGNETSTEQNCKGMQHCRGSNCRNNPGLLIGISIGFFVLWIHLLYAIVTIQKQLNRMERNNSVETPYGLPR